MSIEMGPPCLRAPGASGHWPRTVPCTHADEAMYKAKRDGGNRYHLAEYGVCYNPAPAESTPWRSAPLKNPTSCSDARSVRWWRSNIL